MDGIMALWFEAASGFVSCWWKLQRKGQPRGVPFLLPLPLGMGLHTFLCPLANCWDVFRRARLSSSFPWSVMRLQSRAQPEPKQWHCKRARLHSTFGGLQINLRCKAPLTLVCLSISTRGERLDTPETFANVPFLLTSPAGLKLPLQRLPGLHPRGSCPNDAPNLGLICTSRESLPCS